MSLAREKNIQLVKVIDPVVDLLNQRYYALKQGAVDILEKGYTTTNVSTSSITFSTPSPAGAIALDNTTICFELPVRLVFTGDGANTENILQPGRDAFRYMPIASGTQTINAVINSQSVTLPTSDIIHALTRFNHCTEELLGDFSMTTAMPDQSQNYSDLSPLSNRNPLGQYGSSIEGSNIPRGAFPYTIVSNTPTAAVVDAIITEKLWVSPLFGNKHGLFNLRTLDITFTFVNNLGNRMWSHNPLAGNTNLITNIQVIFPSGQVISPAFSYAENQPKMLLKWVTPDPLIPIPAFNTPLSWNYYDIQAFPTDGSSVAPQGAPLDGNAFQITSNNIQLSSVPNRIYLFVREKNYDLQLSPNVTDTFFAIENVSAQFGSRDGLLASTDRRQLYMAAVRNGCKMSWEEWSGDLMYNNDLTNRISGPGSIVCISFPEDIALPSGMVPGMLGQINIQFQVRGHNRSARTITPSLYVVVVSEGVFEIKELGNAARVIGVMNTKDVIDSKQVPQVSYEDAVAVRGNGGMFGGSAKDFWEKVKKFFRDSKLLSNAANLIPFAGPAISSSISNLGYGVKSGGTLVGSGVPSGGAELNRSSLRDRLRRM